MCSLDGPREFSAICSLVAMYVNDFRNNETVIMTSEKVGTGYTYFQRFFFLRVADGNTSAGLKTMVYSREKSFLIRSLYYCASGTPALGFANPVSKTANTSSLRIKFAISFLLSVL